MTTLAIRDEILLAEASYAGMLATAGTPNEAETRAGLEAAGFTPTQVNYFLQTYRVLHFQPNTDSGFAGMLVTPLDGAAPSVTLALRGTDRFTPADLDANLRGIAGGGAAFQQIVDLYNYWHRLTSPEGASVRLARLGTTTDPNAPGVFFPAVQTPGGSYIRVEFHEAGANGPESGLGVLALGTRMTVAGHSLGGHLAIAFERLFSSTTDNVYVANSAGFRSNDEVGRFFNALAGTDTTFHPNKVINLFGSAGGNFIAGELIYEQIGQRTELYTESIFDWALGHGNAQLTDSAAAYDLLLRTDSTLQDKTPSEMSEFLLDVFKAASPTGGFTLEAVVNMFGKMFVPAYTEIPAELQDNRNVLHQQIGLIRERLPEGTIRVERLADLEPGAVASFAKDDITYRYALRDLNPVAFVGADYSRFEAELKRYDVLSDEGSITDAWLNARADALATKITYNIGEPVVAPSIAIDDRITGFNLVGFAPATSRLVFGADDAESLSGSNASDRIFGGGGGDTLSAGLGADYVEGNDGDDTIDGGWGDDEIYGGQGRDQLQGSLGRDRLIGGAGDDEIDGGWGDDLVYGDAQHGSGAGIVGNDLLTGDSGDDFLYGGAGDDRLHGGEDRDWLEGGSGFDTYVYDAGDGFDTIVDADGQGRVLYKGRELTGGARTGERTYKDMAGVEYFLSGLDNDHLVVDGSLVITDFRPGHLGINLTGELEETEPPESTPLHVYAGHWAPVGASPSDLPASLMYGSEQNDSFTDTDFFGRSGDDIAFLGGLGFWTGDGGLGDDLIDARPTSRGSELAGGAGADYILGGAGDDLIWGDNFRAHAALPWERARFVVDSFAYDFSPSASEDWAFFAQTGGYAPYVLDREVGPSGEELREYVLSGGWVFPGGLADVVRYIVGAGSESFDDYIDAGQGNDTVYGGSGSDELYGGPGDDILSDDGGLDIGPDFTAYAHLFGSPGDDYVDGGDGDDIIQSGGGNDVLLGGPGNDRIDSLGLEDGLPAFNHIDGGDGNDSILSREFGTGFDVVLGGEGNDSIHVSVGEGGAFIDAGPGNDRVVVESGAGREAITVDGGSGDDTYVLLDGTLRDAEGFDTLQVLLIPETAWRPLFDAQWQGSPQDKLMIAVRRRDDDLVVAAAFGVGEMNGFAQHHELAISDWYSAPERPIEALYFGDVSFGQFSPQAFETWGSLQFGTADSESFEGGEHADAIMAGDGNDTIVTGPGEDLLVGGAGDDFIDGGDGNDKYFYVLGHGRDTVVDSGGLDELRFGAGIAPESITATIVGSSVVLGIGPGSIEIAGARGQRGSIESLVFLDGSVLALAELLGAAVAFQGTPGNDVLTGNAGGNELVGGAGNDILRGGAGSDVYFFSLGDGVDQINDAGGEGDLNTIAFGAGITPDMLRLDLGSLVIKVGSDGDAIHLESVDPDDIFGAHDIDQFTFADGTQLSYAQLLERGIDISGSEADDALRGSSITDRIRAGAGSDIVVAGAGDDDLLGGAGDDVLVGGLGSDLYRFSAGDGRDSIADMEAASGDQDIVLFGDGVTPEGVHGERQGEYLVLSIADSADSVAIYWDPASGAAIEQVAFTDGTLWDESFLAQLAAQNRPPAFSAAVPDVQALEDQPFAIQLPEATDPDSEPLSYRTTRADGAPLPEWLTFNPAERRLYGTPDNGDVGDLALRLTAIDGSGESASDDFTLTVINANDFPTLAIPIPDQTAREGVAFSVAVPAGTFVDADTGDSLTLSLALGDSSPLPPWLSFTADGLAGTPGLADGGEYVIQVIAEDTSGATAVSAFRLTVSDSLATDERLIGTPGDDVLNGTDRAEVLDGRAGADRLLAGGGDDILQWFVDARIKGKSCAADFYDGGSGVDVLLGTDRHDAILLVDQTDAPRLADIERIEAGDGHDLVDLRSSRFAYGDVTLDGGRGNDVLRSGAGSDVLFGGPGNDDLSGGAGSDLYVYGLGDGRDTIDEAGRGGEADVLRFGAGITPDMVRANRRRHDLVLEVAGRGGGVTVREWFSSAGQRIERIEFADGTVWGEQAVRAMVRSPAREWLELPPRHHDPDERGKPVSHAPNGRNDEHGDDRHVRDASLVDVRSRIPKFDFQALLQERERSVTRRSAAAVQDIARAWEAVHRFASSLAFEAEEQTDIAMAAWTSGRSGHLPGFGFEASVGAPRGPEGLKSLEGLSEGFRRL